MNLQRFIALLLVMGVALSGMSQGQNSAELLKNEGVEASHAKKFDVAITKFEAALAAADKADTRLVNDLHFKAGMASMQAMKYNKATAHFEACFGDEGKKCNALLYGAFSYGKIKNEQKRIELLEKGFKECGSQKEKFGKELAKIYLKQSSGVYNDGEKLEQSVSALDPKDSKYVSAQAEAAKKYQAALALAEKAYAYDAKNANVLDLLKTLYTKLKMTDKASGIAKELSALKK